MQYAPASTTPRLLTLRSSSARSPSSKEQYAAPVVEVEPLVAYASAEDYHQDYLDKNPGGYRHIDFRLFAKAAEAVPDASHFE